MHTKLATLALAAVAAALFTVHGALAQTAPARSAAAAR